MNHLRHLYTIIFCCCFLTACANVSPWERGILAKPEMAWQLDPLERKMQSHIYTSKEASSGGASAAGGGCGCN
ncbi:MAG: DUF4266 domain-containing protein [Pseudomonadota bacterium]